MKIIADEFSEGLRIDSFLAGVMPDFSRSKIQSLIKSGKILVNNLQKKPSYTLRTGDILDCDTEEAIIKFEPENIPLDVVWEDENMAVINKPSGMLTHPTANETTGTLVNALLYKYGENLSNINGEFRRGIVHRLDRNTSGLIMTAKNNKTHEYLAGEIKERRFSKKYLAIVKGVIEEDEFMIDLPIARNPKQPNKMTAGGVNIGVNVGVNVEGGKESYTGVKVLERFKDATLVELDLITGRTHQIRVHMASIGHPVYNDTLYGFGKMKIKTEEQVLEAYKLEFKKPFSDEVIRLEIPPNEKFEKVLKVLRS